MPQLWADAGLIAVPRLARHNPGMGTIYNGQIADLKALVAALGHEGDWIEKDNGVWRFVCNSKGGLNWASTKGTLWFDGPGPAKTALLSSVESALAGGGILKDFDPAGKTI